MHLLVVEGPAAGLRVPIVEELTVGRGSTGDGTLNGDPELSRAHARFIRTPSGEIVLDDLGSTNGTFVNGERVVGSRVLGATDSVRLGRNTLQVRGLESPHPDRAPDGPQVHESPAGLAPHQPGAFAPEPPTPEPPAPPSPSAPAPAETPITQPLAPAGHGSGRSPGTPLPAPRRRPPIGQPSVVRAGLPATMKGLIFPSVGLLLVQMVLGYEWLVSGLSKVFRSGFVSGLDEELIAQSENSAQWYRDFLDEFIIPNSEAFAYFVTVNEIVIGAILIATAVLWLVAWERLGRRARTTMLMAIVLSCIGGIFLNLNLYLASTSDLPFFIAESPFEEAVGLDLIMPLLEIIIGTVAFWTWLSIRSARNRSAPG